MKTQGFLIRTPCLIIYGLLIKKKGKWIVEEIDRRMQSLKGITARSLKEKCEGWGWTVERSENGYEKY